MGVSISGLTCGCDLEGEFQGEYGALAGAVAVDSQAAAELPGGQGAVVQAKAVAVFAGGKPVVKDFGEVFRWNPDSVVADGYFDGFSAVRAAENQAFVGRACFVASVLRVLDKVHEDAEDLVFFDGDGWGVGEFLGDLDVMAGQGTGIQAEGFLDEVIGPQRFDKA